MWRKKAGLYLGTCLLIMILPLIGQGKIYVKGSFLNHPWDEHFHMTGNGAGIVASTVPKAEFGGTACQYKIHDKSQGIWLGPVYPPGSNMEIRYDMPPVEDILFYYVVEDQSGWGWRPGRNAFGDSWTGLHNPDGTPRRWVATGSFNADLGCAAPWRPSCLASEMFDNGTGGDLIPGDGIFTFRMVAQNGYTDSLWKAVSFKPDLPSGEPDWSGITHLGTNGWAIGGPPPGNPVEARINAQKGQVVFLEMDALRGRLRTTVLEPKLLLNEVVSASGQAGSAAEFIEIYNPNDFRVALRDYYLSDRHDYYRMVESSPPAMPQGDFITRFPADGHIGPGQYQTIALNGADSFTQTYGTCPSYTLGPSTVCSATQMRPAYADSIGTLPSLREAGEPVVLYYLPSASDGGRWDRGWDVDYVYYGSPDAGNPQVDKTGIQLDSVSDLDNRASLFSSEKSPQEQSRAEAPLTGEALARRSPAEGSQTLGGNGLTGLDETSEAMTASWIRSPTPTPNGPNFHALSGRIILSDNPVDQSGTVVSVTLGGHLYSTATGNVGSYTLSPLPPGTHRVSASRPEYIPSALTGVVVTQDVQGLNLTLKKVDSVEVIPSDDTALLVGDALTLKAEVRAAGSVVENPVITWKTTAPSIAGVTQGVVTGLSVGTSQISALAFGVESKRVDFYISAEPEQVVVTPAQALLELGTQQGFSALAIDANGRTFQNISVTWQSQHPSIASVNQSGLVTAQGAGLSTLIATVGQRIGKATIQVIRKVTAIDITPAQSTLYGPGNTLQLTALAKDSGGASIAEVPLQWESDNPIVATVNASGLVTARAQGTVHITARFRTTTSAPATLTVKPSLVTITVTPPTAELFGSGTRTRFQAEARDINGNIIEGVSLNWNSIDPGIATIDETGWATAIATGVTQITASQGDLFSNVVLLHVKKAVEQIEVTPVAATLFGAGDSQQFKAVARDNSGHDQPSAPLTWNSSNRSVAIIDAHGLVTAIGPGTTEITASFNLVTSNVVVLVVEETILSIEVTPASAQVFRTETVTAFSARARGQSGAIVSGVPFSWKSANPAVATVDEDGKVTALSPGQAAITASYRGITSNRALFTVRDRVGSIVITPDPSYIAIGATQQYRAVIRDTTNRLITELSITWSSSRPAVASIHPAYGQALGKSPGSTMITASVEGKTSDPVLLVVNEMVKHGCSCRIDSGTGPVRLLPPLAILFILLLRRRQSK